jgi:hypothetical protein
VIPGNAVGNKQRKLLLILTLDKAGHLGESRQRRID